jgi:hypothetical protein
MIHGPTVTDPARRSQSPTRPALQRRSGRDGSRSPSAQLQEEEDEVQGPAPSRKAPGMFEHYAHMNLNAKEA